MVSVSPKKQTKNNKEISWMQTRGMANRSTYFWALPQFKKQMNFFQAALWKHWLENCTLINIRYQENYLAWIKRGTFNAKHSSLFLHAKCLPKTRHLEQDSLIIEKVFWRPGILVTDQGTKYPELRMFLKSINHWRNAD